MVPTGGEGSGSPLLDLDLQVVCKRAAAKLKIQWPEVQLEAPTSHYDGKMLPKVKKTGKQFLHVFFPDLLEEFTVSWCNKPHREKHSVAGCSVLH